MDHRPHREPILSDFAEDPDMKDLLGTFVSELPHKLAAIREAWDHDNLASLTRIAHQLKGAGGGYGFGVIGDAAARLEATLTTGTQDVDRARAQMDELIDLCQRAQA
jgi:HPt (histidine-containing phosphotransfer) domain-containing protein